MEEIAGPWVAALRFRYNLPRVVAVLRTLAGRLQ